MVSGQLVVSVSSMLALESTSTKAAQFLKYVYKCPICICIKIHMYFTCARFSSLK